jgi:capsular exopolysaccharide synthesis family protein
MAFNEYIQILRRRWVIVLAGLLVGFVAGYVTAPGAGSDRPDYKATTTLVANPALQSDSNGKLNNLDTAALLVTTGSVPVRAAHELGIASADQAAKRITAESDPNTGAITVTAVDKNPVLAQRRSKVFADQLIVEMTRGDLAAYQDSVDRADARISSLKRRVFAWRVQNESNPNPDPTDLAQQRQLETDLAAAQTSRDELQKPKALLVPLEYGKAKKVDPPGLEPPKGKVQRGILLGGLGLLLGIGAAVGLDRLDTKIRTKATAQHAFGHPVVGEVPPLPGGRRGKSELLALSRPASPVMEAYRGLRTVLTLVHPVAGSANGNGNGTGSNGNGKKAEHEGKVVVIASGAAGEGKTTTSAHLAAVLAEGGFSVLTVSADFRRPRLHLYFDVPRDPGLTEALLADEVSLKHLLLDTPIPGLRILTSGEPARNPAPLMGRTVDLLHAARKVFDYVIVDTAPLLIANDASELIQASDAVILMARSARTSIEAALRSAELMTRINAPVLGVVLVGSTDSSGGYYYYYRYKYYSDRDERRREKTKRRGRGESKTKPATPAS